MWKFILRTSRGDGLGEYRRKLSFVVLLLIFPFTHDVAASPPSAEEPINISAEYYMFGLMSPEVIRSKKSALSGIARASLDYKAYEEGEDSGSFKLKVDHKHSYSKNSPSSFVMNNIGGFGLIGPAFSDIGFRLTHLYWKQTFNAQQTALMVGFLDSTDYVDMYALGNPYFGFSNVQFSTGAGTIAIPDESTFGLSISHFVSDRYYLNLSLSDALADSTEPCDGLSHFFKNHQFFKSLEFGLVSSQDSFLYQNIHLTAWHSDGIMEQADENYGFNVSAVYQTGNWIPFFRAGTAKGPELLYQSSVVAGFGYKDLGPGTFGFAVGWGEPNSSDDEVYNAELFYLTHIGPVSLTPTVQFLSPLPFNSRASDAWVFGLRGRVSFSL